MDPNLSSDDDYKMLKEGHKRWPETHSVLLANAKRDGDQDSHQGAAQTVLSPAPVCESVVELPVSETKQMVSCSRRNGDWKCPRMFEQEYRDVKGKMVPFKLCPHHRLKGRDDAKTKAGVANRKRNRLTEKGKETAIAYNSSDKRKAVLKKFNATDKRKLSGVNYRNTPKGKSNAKRAFSNWYEKLKQDGPRLVQHNIRKKMSEVIRYDRPSTTLEAATGLNHVELKQHFESLWPPLSGMCWQNYGDDNGCWHVGHRIALSKFDCSDEDDTKRCWNPRNLFPQWRTDNHKQHTSLPPLHELVSMQDFYPRSWGGRVPM
tara:strand:- start:756 stop:1709 length:954 start_codon:yes stop_codon:yes gene_type:complete